MQEERARYRLTIKELPAGERPREKLKLRGAASLSTGELLAIILRTGVVGETVTDVAQRLLATYGGLLGLSRVDYETLCRERGLGEAKAAQLKACVELARRLALERPEERARIQSPEDIAALLSTEMAALDQEELRAVLLNTKNEVLKVVMVYRGSVNAAQVRVGEIFKEAVRLNAPALVVVHNHPSGDPTPSSDDVAVTRELVKGGKLLDIDVLDHLVIGDGRHVSLRRRGLGFE
ncbi:MAG TPA: DNA repair protein RadC [Thermomicrobiales bacterium]|nr:DNA repair protein RadC [Thermomicrobiales bacterium]